MSAGGMTDDEIRNKLLSYGYNCGPVTDSTRPVLLKKLGTLKKSSRALGRGRSKTNSNNNDENSENQYEAMEVD